MADANVDVIIVGGGVAGLAAADMLSAEGKSVVLLEGRARLGGRIETRHDPAWPLPIERGAEFIHGKPMETWEIVQAGACSLYNVTNEHWVYEQGKLRKPKGFFEDLEKVMERVKKGAWKGKEDMSFEEFMAAKGGRGIGAEAKRRAKMFVEGFNAADAREVSARWLADAQKASEEIDGDKLFRVYAGYDRIVQFLKSGLGNEVQVELSTTVKKISWTKERVIVETVGSEGSELAHTPGVYMARKVLITVPLGVLQAKEGPGVIAFDPPLPAEKVEAIGQMRMGSVVKVVMRFREAFWEEHVPEMDFVHAPGVGGKGEEAGFPTWWTTLPIRTGVLTGWAGGPAAERLTGKSTDRILSIAIKELARVLEMGPRGKSAVEKQLLGAHVCDWKSEPLSRGAYSYAAVGGADAWRQLSRPVEGSLYFAGEATYGGMSGTVAGAIASGRRAAREAMRG
jgi:monoamine oxidase